MTTKEETKEEKTDEEKLKEKEERRKRMRYNTVKELVETEKSYLTDLNILTQLYIEPLSNYKIITEKQHKLFFMNIPSLVKLHTMLSKRLTERFEKWDPKKSQLGDIFVEFSQMFKMYRHYLQNHQQGSDLTRKLENKNSKFRKFLMQQQLDVKAKQLDMGAYLVKPLQRILKYTLLLEQIIKYSNSDHPDYKNLQEAVDNLTKQNQEINEKIKDWDLRQKVRLYERRMNLDLVLPHRRFIKEDILWKICRKDVRPYTFVLFNDLLIYGITKSNKLNEIEVHQKLPINNSFKVKNILLNEKYGTKCWEIHSTVKSFVVYAGSPAAKIEWLKEFNDIISTRLETKHNKTKTIRTNPLNNKNNNNNSDVSDDDLPTAPLWIPDDFSTVCMIADCNNKFGIMNRRHHCRYCGYLICGKCGKYKVPDRIHKNKKVRICKTCARLHIQKTSSKNLLKNKDVIETNTPTSPNTQLRTKQSLFNLDIDLKEYEQDSSEDDDNSDDYALSDSETRNVNSDTENDNFEEVNFVRSRSNNMGGRDEVPLSPHVKKSHHKNKSSLSNASSILNFSGAGGIKVNGKIYTVEHAHNNSENNCNYHNHDKLKTPKTPTGINDLKLHERSSTEVVKVTSNLFKELTPNESIDSDNNKSSVKLDYIGDGKIELNLHSLSNGEYNLTFQTFTELIQWNLSPKWMKPKKIDQFTCIIKVYRVLSETKEIISVRIKNKKEMNAFFNGLTSIASKSKN